jgi:Holliday junction resolvase RusA-like endonuclease
MTRDLVIGLTLTGPPMSWARARDTGEDGYANPLKYSRWLTATGRAFAREWRDQTGRRKDPIDGPVAVELLFLLRRPARRPASVPVDLWGLDRCPAIGRQDLDNLAAAVFDAVTRAAWWTDDTRAASLHAAKVWLPAGDENERTELRIYRLGL